MKKYVLGGLAIKQYHKRTYFFIFLSIFSWRKAFCHHNSISFFRCFLIVGKKRENRPDASGLMIGSLMSEVVLKLVRDGSILRHRWF